MADIDDILNELGVSSEDAKRPPRRLREPERRQRHSIDSRPSSFSPLPAMPSGQRRFGEDGRPIDDDPAVPNAPAPVRDTGVGSSVAEIYQPDDEPSTELAVVAGDLRERLLSSGVIKPGEMTAAEQVIKQSPGQSLVRVLIDQGADEVAIQRVVAEVAGVPFERINLEAGLDGGFDGRMLQRLGGEFCKTNLVLPLRMEGSRAVVGSTRPDDIFVLDEMRSRLGVPSVKIVLVTISDIRGALEMMGESSAEDDDLNEILADVDEADVEVSKSDSHEAVDLEARAGESPVIRYVNYIIQTAVKEGASDIHVEPNEKKLKVRFRIDGILFEMMNPPPGMSAAIVSRLKIMADLDISERRIPQDGRIRCTVQGRKLDLRVSTLPAGYGEKVVMRILDTKSINVQLEELGFDELTLEIWKQQIHQPHGIVLVTGPTGSGKTTTLYSSLRQLDKNKLNISTVEDPIEYHLDGITQTQTHDRIGMSFAKALKALLRQDPDIIMVGEIRDQETAHTAVQAALTGHLVLSTLHTNDAPSSVTRLVNIGLEPFLVGAALNAVLAQRLLRRLCQQCKAKEAPSEEMAEFLELQGLPSGEMWGPQGCDKCRNTGYSGRVGAYELLAVDDALRDVIARNPNVSEFRRMCLERGMQSLRQDGINKAMSGLTSIPEVIRVTSSH
ncbi:MAG: Flp pilus assembly complex ATPase component TadA [Phycisphaerales bacterium]|nr:Flp pilus assembly complex ATPase component TadA [Planctomycetota bacterium]MCH8509499.1 Flp pilus assembly complex ATPase component TadA [Phycisphaerales bacterium]